MSETIPSTFFPRQSKKGTLHIDVVVALELLALLRRLIFSRHVRVRAPVPGHDCAQLSPLGLNNVLDVLVRNTEKIQTLKCALHRHSLPSK